ncbi:MAG: glycosyltransferase [Candidatus Omnitrophica bacterium]|nr:glycosyltransferase [Candidatus Omnitrophota bacterium]
MNILIIHPHDIYSPLEPWTRRVKSIAQELHRRNHKVKLVYFSSARKLPLPSSRDGYEAIPFDRHISPAVFIKTTLRLIKLAKWADVVHVQKCHHYAAVPAAAAAYLSGKPLHYDWDDWEEMIWYESCGRNWHSFLIGFSFKILEKSLPVLSDSVSVSSSFLGKLALQFGAQKKNIFSAPVGADTVQFSPRVDGSKVKKEHKVASPLVLYIGQLNGAQYIEMLIKAAEVILRKYPHTRFMVVGGGFRQEYLEGLVKELNMKDSVIFTGSVSFDKVPEYIAAADICVACFQDTLVTRCKSPLKVAEYLASGKPIVASDVGEVRNMVESAGILTLPGDVDSLVKGITMLLEDEKLRLEMGRLSRKRAEDCYNWSRTTDNILEAYGRIRG